MDARSYIDEIVVPTLEDYAANITSIRHGFLACVATFHTVDYLAAPKSPKALREKIGRACPSFALIDQIAHAFKHTSVKHPKRGAPAICTDDVVSRPPAVWGEAQWDTARWGDTFGGVTLATNIEKDLLDELNEALACLKAIVPSMPEEWVAKILMWARQHERIASVHLFGSRAKGNHLWNSDVDLAVLISGKDRAEAEAYAICMAERWRTEIDGMLSVKIDLHFASPETDQRVWPAVLDHGKQIYLANGPNS